MNEPLTPASDDFAAFVERAWEKHGDDPRAVATALRKRAAAIDADEAGEDAIALAEHVWLAHLDEPAAFAAFLDALPHAAREGPPTAAIVARGRWALAALEGSATQAIPDGDRWRALQSVWSVYVARGRAAEVLAQLQTEVPAALLHPEVKARRGLAATCNNLAVELRLGERGDAARDALMLALAQASRTLWSSAGTWVHAERAQYQLARCHAVLGAGERALAHAQACLATIEAHAEDPKVDAFERFFAHEALAWAYRALGEASAVARERTRMAELVVAVTDAGARAWCEEALRDFAAALKSSSVYAPR